MSILRLMTKQTPHRRRSRMLRKVRQWIVRYAPAEVCGTVTALLGAWIGHTLSGSLAVAAVSGTVSENIGYYGYSFTREVLRCLRQHRVHARLKRTFLTAWHSMRNIFIEFGPAELADSLAVRPASLYVGALVAGNFWVGMVVGKLLADVVFYSIAIVGYELRRKYLPEMPSAAEEAA